MRWVALILLVLATNVRAEVLYPGGVQGSGVVRTGTAAPVNLGAPSISGTGRVGSALTTTDGTWTKSPTYTYQWKQCDAAGANCFEIVGATASTYSPVDVDAGNTVRSYVTATASGKSATANSEAFAVTQYLLPDLASTTCHVWFNGSAVQDSKDCAWTMAGTVPQVAASNGYAGAGPFSTSNYYTTPSAGVLDLGNSVPVTVEYVIKTPASMPNYQYVLTTRWSGTTGFDAELGAASTFRFYGRVQGDVSGAPYANDNTAPANATKYYVVVTVTWAAGKGRVRVYRNGVETVGTEVSVSNTITTANVARMGVSASWPVTGTIYEVQVHRGTALSGTDISNRYDALASWLAL